jgi:hypothetical protein
MEHTFLADYNRRHGVVEPNPIGPGCTVWIPDLRKEGTVVARHSAPRSLDIETSDGDVVRRNQRMVRKTYPQPTPTSVSTPSAKLTLPFPGAHTPSAPAFCVPRLPVSCAQPNPTANLPSPVQPNPTANPPSPVQPNPTVNPPSPAQPTCTQNVRPHQSSPAAISRPTVPTTRSGRIVRRPARYKD